jgi:hypothetical protein
MIEPTEREKKLIEYILRLVEMLNHFEFFYACVRRYAEWLEGQFGELKFQDTQNEMIDYLKVEYGISLVKRKASDVIEEKEKKSNEQ